MRRLTLSVSGVVLLGAMLVAAEPAQAFRFLGINFGGEDEAAEDGVAIVDPLAYTVRFEMADDDLRDRVQGASALWTGREDPASGAAGLISTAQADYRALLAALYAEGYYAGAISISVNGREAADLSLAADLPAPAQVVVSVDPGPPFVFGRTGFVNPAPAAGALPDTGADQPQEMFRPGLPARAGIVNAAGDQEVKEWRRVGRPKARVAEREVIADHGTGRLDVTIRMDPGPEARFGPVTVTGTGGVNADFVRYMADIPEGARYDPERIAAAAERLNDLRVFRAVRVVEGEQVLADGTLPLDIETLRRPPRRFGVGATFSSIEGLGLEGFWLHRNLLGSAERLRFDASISGIGAEDDPEDYDYRIGLSFEKPGFLDQENTLIANGEIVQEVFDTYRERAVRTSLGLSRRFNPDLEGSVALAVGLSEVEDDLGTREFLLISLPVGATLDKRNNEFDATEGYYLTGELRPFVETEFSSTGLRAELEGRTYLSFAEGRTVVALRGKYGALLDGALTDIPPDLSFFAGGGGSIRGYAFRSIGLETALGTVGGRSLVEGSVELRQRIGESFGVTAFVDAGLVSDEVFPGEFGDARFGAGLGVRYYTGLGPLRFDLATPLDPRSGDPDIAFYIGIGQAF
ncbi:outer membrane protein assembly factor [Halovulum dunhuangense]|uniref:Outer membrane protein assembly factor n=1 Tax=Halovulum dunhuangense TaxID=1505036 RepID=A0A849KPT8_9RHOB|nr:autotransporter assembly complex family protein [Halovulum dunhuangense]NNU79073.1 outer membrane protein assembly factor [Halovulum dunhuangense]